MKNKITRALIIDEPWISLTLEEKKLWEMRSSLTKIRGTIALIKKGTKTIVGCANLIDSYGPLTLQELEKNSSKHCIPRKLFQNPSFSWRFVWQLENVTVLSEPLPIDQKRGSVIWVKLDEHTSEKLTTMLDELG